MTIQYVNTGSGANAGDGDSLRTAFYKINNNFAELSALSGTDSSVIIVNAFPPTTSTEGTIWYDTVSGRNFIYYDGFWVDAAPPVADPVDLTTVTSHILPGADLTYDLGSTSSQWRSLYVGSSTIYLGGTSLSIVDGRLTVDGMDSATTSSLRNNGSSLSIDSTGTAVFLPSGNSVIRSFNNLSGDGYGTSIIELIPDFQLANESNNHQYLVIDPSGAENHVHIRTGGDRDNSNAALWLGGSFNHVLISDPENLVRISAKDGPDNFVEWYFTGDGKLSLPTTVPGIAIDLLRDSPGDHLIRIEPEWKVILQARATYPNDGHLELEAGQNTKILIHGDGSNIDYVASDGSTTQTWTMNLSGELVFPDGSIQTTAYTGSTSSNATTSTLINGTFTLILNETGEIVLPNASSIIKTEVFDNNGNPFNSIVLTPQPDFDVGQGLRIYPTYAEGGHLHITANTSTVDLFLGNDNTYVKIAYDGLVELSGNTTRLWGEGEFSNTHINLPNNSDSDSVPTLITNYGLAGVKIETSSTGYAWNFGSDGNLTFPDGTTQTTAYKTGAGSWSLEPGANTVSFAVNENASYTMWVRGNIPNGIVVWNATVSLSNSNVPAIGNHYGWYYAEGNNLVLDSIPNQIIGTVGTISSATVVTTNSNVFSFGITNNSSSTQVVNWGYVTI